MKVNVFVVLEWILGLLFLASVVAVCIFDWLAITEKQPTLSLRIWHLATHEPIMVVSVCLVVGILLGHLFWRIQQ